MHTFENPARDGHVLFQSASHVKVLGASGLVGGALRRRNKMENRFLADGVGKYASQ